MRPSGSDQSTQRTLTVLVVEDDFLIAMDLETTFERHGWRVLGPAPSVEEALRLLQIERPDVALLDVDLGGQMVTPVAEALRSLHVPFVLSSASDSRDLDGVEVLAEAPNVGKPASERRLLAALEQAVGRAHAADAGATQDSAFVLGDHLLPGTAD